MKALVKVVGETSIPYYIRGEKPTLLIHAGIHGDEFGVVESVKKAVKKYHDLLPNFVYVPVVSPSAVKNRTRLNSEGYDLNRNFLDNSEIPEIRANMEIVRNEKFEILVTFHEDPELNAKFYMYDYGCGISESDAWKVFLENIKTLGIELLNGTDDSSDPSLNYIFSEGYHYWDVPPEGFEGSYFEDWVTRSGVVRKSLLPEIPGHLPQKTKDKIVELFFQYFLLRQTDSFIGSPAYL